MGDGATGRMSEFAAEAPGVRRLAARASVAFLLDMVSLARQRRHPLDALLLSTIVQANVAPVMAQADLQVSFATADRPPPDEMRRPISINAVAASLRLPFETVRRRIHRLQAAGLCRVSAAGVMVPGEVLASPEYLTHAFAGYERLRAFYAVLRDMGALGELPGPTVALADGLVPLRAVARAASEYVLRAADVAQAEFGDLLSCLLLLEILRSNTEHLGFEPELPQMLDSGGFLLDIYRRPVRMNTLAQRAGLSAETSRRHLSPLIARGWIQQGREGVIAPASMLVRPRVARFMGQNQIHLRRMFAALSQLGVLGVWDELNPKADPILWNVVRPDERTFA